MSTSVVKEIASISWSVRGDCSWAEESSSLIHFREYFPGLKSSTSSQEEWLPPPCLLIRRLITLETRESMILLSFCFFSDYYLSSSSSASTLLLLQLWILTNYSMILLRFTSGWLSVSMIPVSPGGRLRSSQYFSRKTPTDALKLQSSKMRDRS